MPHPPKKSYTTRTNLQLFLSKWHHKFDTVTLHINTLHLLTEAALTLKTVDAALVTPEERYFDSIDDNNNKMSIWWGILLRNKKSF